MDARTIEGSHAERWLPDGVWRRTRDAQDRMVAALSDVLKEASDCPQAVDLDRWELIKERVAALDERLKENGL